MDLKIYLTSYYRKSISIIKFLLTIICNPVRYKRKFIFYVKLYGLKGTLEKFIQKAKTNIIIYKDWIKFNEPDELELEKQRKTKFQLNPKISIITPAYKSPEKYLDLMINSVLNQTYPGWEMCIANGENSDEIKKLLCEYSKKDSRIKVKFLTNNRGIAGNSNEAISLATGDFMALLDQDDLLPPFALFEVVKAINTIPDCDYIYSDEDKIIEDLNTRHSPHFKPDWSPDTFHSYNYTSHLSVFRSKLVNSLGGFREGFEGSQDYDLILRMAEKTSNIVHIPKILYHWRIHPDSTADEPTVKLYAYDSAKKALESHFNRLNIDLKLEDGLSLSTYKSLYKINSSLKISIIIPNRDHKDDLKRCINSIIEKASYKNIEFIIIENSSVEGKTFDYYDELKKIDYINIIKWDKPFNYSAANNFAVSLAKGDILLFLNNDTEIINSDCLERMLEHAIRKEIGPVGAKLYYPDNTIQHGGIIIGLGGTAGHSHKYFPGESEGYFFRLKIVQNLSAVTAACMMLRKDLFYEAGGFDEEFALAFNDVDLCLRLREKGYLVVWTPYAELYHYESKTRGLEDTIEKKMRFQEEISLFRRKWAHILDKGDPYYNPNLSLDNENFSIKVEL